MCQKDSSLLCSEKLFPSLVIPPLALTMLSSSLYLTLRQGVHTTARERYSLLLVSLLPTRPCYRSLPESLSQHLALCTLALLLSRALILVLSAIVTDKTLGTNTTWREKRLCGLHTGHSSLVKEGKARIKAGTRRQEPWRVQHASLLSGSVFHRLHA